MLKPVEKFPLREQIFHSWRLVQSASAPQLGGGTSSIDQACLIDQTDAAASVPVSAGRSAYKYYSSELVLISYPVANALVVRRPLLRDAFQGVMLARWDASIGTTADRPNKTPRDLLPITPMKSSNGATVPQSNGLQKPQIKTCNAKLRGAGLIYMNIRYGVGARQ
jgi:hypothetical protein